MLRISVNNTILIAVGNPTSKRSLDCSWHQESRDSVAHVFSGSANFLSRSSCQVLGTQGTEVGLGPSGSSQPVGEAHSAVRFMLLRFKVNRAFLEEVPSLRDESS